MILERWLHQERAVEAVHEAISRGERRICLTSPTGGGKTVIATDLIRDWLSADLKVILYSNRRMLIEQTSRVMREAGLVHGVRAAGHDETAENLQLSSIQTEGARVVRRGMGRLFEASRVLVDEAHLLKSTEAAGILAQHVEQGASVVGLTATPLDIGHLYDHLIVAGTLTDLRACGAVVMARHFGCDEPDLKSIKKIPTGEDIPESQLKKVYPCTQALFGRVLGEFRRLNPECKPSILFACGVDESVWFCGQFNRAGITAAHIDGDNVLIGDKLYRSSPEARAEVLGGSKDGRIKVVCNRFVLREGIDCPWLAHAVFATVFGSLQSYLQAGGRLLRAYPGINTTTVQDHGGNWWRHGSLNADREWNLAFTPGIVSGLREDALRAKKLFEPFLCPQCKQVLMSRRCPCGFEIKNFVRSRPVVQTDGTLREMRGEIFKPRRVSKAPNGPAKWKSMYYRSKTDKGSRTFRAAAALFAQENNWGWPDPTWPLMPTQPLDWFRLVASVPMEELTQSETLP